MSCTTVIKIQRGRQVKGGEEDTFQKKDRNREWMIEGGGTNNIQTTTASRCLPNNCTDALNMSPNFLSWRRGSEGRREERSGRK